MTSWGFSNAAREPWDFGHPGWVNERSTGLLMISPVQDTLIFEVLAWTPSTKGVVNSAFAVHMVLPDRPTQEELTAYFAGMSAKVGKKIISVGKPAVISVTIEPAPAEFWTQLPSNGSIPNRFLQGQGSVEGQVQLPPRKPNALTNAQINEQLDAFLVVNKVALRK
ncbi:MAG: hypothetical protein IPQ00_00085 [Chloracidobacterium sp.]|nr:hypothetical protein [Chloracidobacterium sp.]